MKNLQVLMAIATIFFSMNAGAHFEKTCSFYKNTTGSCFIQYDGVERGICEVCREKKSCFMALEGQARELCQAYVEGRSCFITINGSTDRGWCEVLKEGKSCFMALNGEEQRRCERGEYPSDHLIWNDRKN